MQSPGPVRIGTRQSPLALTQTSAFVRRLEARWTETQFTLVPIDTRGDKNRAVSLSTVNDALFFSAELDAALASGEVDLCVHSLKDLPEERPFHGVLPEREDPRDVVLVRKDAVERLKTGQGRIVIGTSTSRRATNVVDFVRTVFGGPDESRLDLQLQDIRGNIDQRLDQLVSDERRYDAIVLALAGLNRLWSNESARPRLREMLEQLRWMVLPLEACPTAAGQGVLIVECRADDDKTIGLLEPFKQESIAAEVALERRLLGEIEGEDRSTFGASALHHEKLGLIAWVRGHVATADGSAATDSSTSTIDARLVWHAPPRPSSATGWEGSRWSSASTLERASVGEDVWDAAAIFVAHSRALPDVPSPDSARVWAAGLQTWKALVRRGIWVEGCAEVLGFESLIPTLQCEVLQLPALPDWRVLTHADAVASWEDFGMSNVVATYRLSSEVSPGAQAEVRAATHFYWTSSAQYLAVREWLPEAAQHACGPGKTIRALTQAGLSGLQVFPSVKEWRTWLA